MVGGAILRDGRLLTARRRNGAYAGMWEFPGGKIEPGESSQDALRRELQEELGVEVEVGEPLHQPDGNPWWPLAHGLTMVVHVCALTRGEPTSGPDHDLVEWVEPALVGDDRPWIPADLPIVSALADRMATTAGSNEPGTA